MSLGDLYKQAALYQEQLTQLEICIGEEYAWKIHQEVKAEANAYNLITATQRLNNFVRLAAYGFPAEHLLKAAMDHNENDLLFAYEAGIVRPDAVTAPVFPRDFFETKAELDTMNGLIPTCVKEVILAHLEKEPQKED